MLQEFKRGWILLALARGGGNYQRLGRLRAAASDSSAGACASVWNPFSSQFWSCLNSNLADQYSAIQYGAIPAASGVQPPGVPVLNPDGTIAAPTAQDALDQSIAAGQAATISTQQAAINAAIAGGSYNPAGNLPVNASGLNTSFVPGVGTLLLVGGGLLLLLEVSKKRT